MSEQTLRLVDRLRARLSRTLRRMTWADAAFGGAVVLGTLAAAWLVLAAVEATAWLAPTPRTVLAGLAAAITLGVAGTVLARPLGRLVGLIPMPSEEEIARVVGQRYPEVSDRLVNLLHLVEGRRSHAPEPMVDRAVQRLGSEVEPVAFEEMEDFDRARRAVRLASLPVVGVLAFLLVAPSTFLGASQRLLAPQTAFQRPAPFQLSVTPGDTRLVKGDSLQITIRATGDVPSAIDLALEPENESSAETVSLSPVSSSGPSTALYRHTVASVRTSLRYRASSGRVETNWYTADVSARPLVRSLQIRLTPPSYTGLPNRTLDPNVGDVTGLPGSNVAVSASVGGPEIRSATLVFDDGSEVPLTIDGSTARGTFPLRREGTYRIRLESAEGVSNRDPIRYRTSLRADARPSVVFLAPEPVADLDEDLAARLRLRLSDDYGFSRLRLHYRLAEQRFGGGESEFRSMDVPLDDPSQLDQEVVFDWLLAQDSGLDLVPGDVVAYYVTVWDNDTVAGYKAARTSTQTLRLPSVAEKYEQLDEAQNSAEETMEELRREAEDVGQQFDDLKKELRRKQDAGWEDRRQLDQIQEKQKSLDEGVQELSRQVESLTRKMQEDNLTSPETAEKYRELQRVIEEIDSPELRNALQKLQESMTEMNLRQMQQAMEDFEFNEDQYRERLDRTLELFKQIKAQQKLEEVAKRAGDLAELQKQLREETRKRQGEEAPERDRDSEDSDDTDAEDEAPDGDANGDTPTDAEESDADANETASGDDAKTSDASSSDDASQEEESPKSESSSSDGSQESSSQDEQRPPNGETPQTPPNASNESLAQEQERAAEQMRDLMEEMQKLQDEMKDVPASPQQKMEQLNQQMQQQNLPQQMQQNSQQLRQNQLQNAQQGQQQMQQQLQQLQQQLQQMKQGMQGQQTQMNVAGLRAALDNTLRLSRDQEELRQTVSGLTPDSPTLRRYAQNQQELSSGLESVSDSLQTLARRIPQMSRAIQKETGDALREMSDATESLSERNAGRATGHQKGSMMHLNELALLLSDLLNQMQNGQGSGSGMSMQQMLQQLQKMSGQQQKLNQQIQQFLNDVQGNRLSVDQQKRLQQLAEQQQQLKKQLDDLGKGSGLRDDVMGDLDRIAEKMEETIRELQEGRQGRRTIDRQRQILTRLLEAQRSLRTQGKENKRQGRQSEDEFERESPEELSPQEQADRLRRDLIRALETGYAPDYEELIKRYFELLQDTSSNGSVGGSE